MSSNYLFLCYSNFNTGRCISVPYEVNKDTDYMILAQHLYKRFDGELHFDEILRAIREPDIGDNIFPEPFGWDGTYATLYIEDSYATTRNEWNIITSEMQVYMPVPYAILNGEVFIIEHDLINETSLIKELIANILYAVSTKSRNNCNAEQFDYKASKNELVKLFNTSAEFEYHGQHVMHGFKFETKEELVASVSSYNW